MGMKQLAVILILIIMILMESSDGQYPSCIDNCPKGSTPLVPLSYNTIRSHVFNGTQPSNGGCTEGAGGQMTINCGLKTALLDCESNFNKSNFSDLSNLSTFTWNKTVIFSQQVSITFTFIQEISINIIRMFFWNSTRDNIRVPSVTAYWSNDDTRIPSNLIVANYNINCSNGTGGCVLTIIGGNSRLKFQYLRITMTFHLNQDWIFLSEMQFCGNTAPYHITQPPTDNYEHVITPTATTANITCALNITLTTSIFVYWTHNNVFLQGQGDKMIKTGNTVTLCLKNLQSSDLGDYECIFRDTNELWRLRRTITLVIKTACTHLPTPANGRIELCSSGRTGMGFEGDTCSFTCNTGFELISSNTSTCQSNGSWSDSDIVCRQVTCLPLVSPINGTVNCSLGDDENPSYEDTCSFTCNTGYELTANDTRTCQSDGSWSGSDTKCERVPCPQLINPDNGIINCSLGDDRVPSYEDTCSYTCNTGYELTGSNTRICQSNGSWSGSNVACRNQRVTCPPLSEPDNGVIDCSLGDDVIPAHEYTCSFMCNTGYELIGSDTRTCLSNANWSGSETICIRVQCHPPINGILRCPNETTTGVYRDTCTFSCKRGFELQGQASGTCLANQQWSGGNPICSASKNVSCVTYTPTGFCRDFQSLFDHPVKLAVDSPYPEDITDSDSTATLFHNILTSTFNPNKKCLDVVLPFICRGVLPTCDPAFNVSVRQRICIRTSYLNIIDLISISFSTCNPNIRANGGEAPDCIDTLDGGKIPVFAITGDCFNGYGRGYNGTINITRSGKICQRWSEQAPHRFILPSKQYPEIAGGHNYCRNPGSRGPKGPWCFTTDPYTRWEYCDVPKCEPSASCELYLSSPNSICFGYGSIGYDYVFINNTVDTMDSLNSKLKAFNTSLYRRDKDTSFPPECLDLIFGLMCHHSFPLCDHNSETPVPRKLCKSYCEEISKGKCRSPWDELKSLTLVAIIKLPDCESLPSPEGGDYLECFIPYNNGRDPRDINSTNCYTEDDLGIRYNGTVNVTVSGRMCQPWDSDSPHFHPITSLFRYYLENHNYCRNPEGRGKRPWCYTMDPNVRWEYCNVPNCDATSKESSNSLIIGIAVGIPVLIIVVLVLVIIVVLLHILSKEKKAINSPSKSDDNENKMIVLHATNVFYDQAMLNFDTLPNFPREKIKYIGDLGQGNFGMVIKGEAMGINPHEPSTLVAIKMLKEESGKDAKDNFKKEAILMSQFNHPNILKLLGVCFDQEPLYLIFEYMDLGDLNHYLRKTAISSTRSSSTLTSQQLVDMAINIAAGLEYLAVRHYVHRDLATRNCLIDEKLFVKIADFGLSKDVYTKDYYRLGEKSVLPIRWMPPEAVLYCKFSIQSDIWSFGIVLWEIFSSGIQPYCALSNEEVVEHVTKGKLLQCPSGCPKDLYHLMIRCWESEPNERPTASEVYTYLLKWSPDYTPGYIVMKPSLSSSPGDTVPNKLDETVM